MRKRNSGFTMIEFAIVIVTIGILITLVAAGGRLIKAAQMNNLITEIVSYKQAVAEFYDIYGQLPGDFDNASGFWSGAVDGDGDKRIETSNNETSYEALHLHYAGLIQDNFYLNSNANYYIKIGDIIYTFLLVHTAGTGGWKLSLDKNVLIIRNSENPPPLTPKEAYYIDRFFDDGVANTGVVTYRVIGQVTNASCTEGGNQVDYKISSDSLGCNSVHIFEDRLQPAL